MSVPRISNNSFGGFGLDFIDFCFMNFLDFNCGDYYDGALSAIGAREGFYLLCSLLFARAGFSHRRVLSRTPLIIRTVDQKPPLRGLEASLFF